jgi:outer membrane protein assembly factor BamB
MLSMLALLSSAADWPQFRGPGGSSVATDGKLPTQWGFPADAGDKSDKDKKGPSGGPSPLTPGPSPARGEGSFEDAGQGANIAWVVPLPGRSVSSPIVVRGRVIVTCSSGPEQERLHVLSYDAATGQLAWQRQFWATGRTMTHQTSAVAANTPASDGEAIFAFFSSNDLICLELDGTPRWMRGLTLESPTSYNDTGMSSSPLVAGPSVVVQIESHGKSFAAAVDRRTGQTRWQVDREAHPNWVSPALLPGHDGSPDLVLLQSGDGLTAHKALDGEQVWKFEGKCDGIPSTLATGEMVFVPAKGLTALRSADGTPQTVWSEAKLAAGNASPVLYDGRIYVLNRAGALSCGKAESGDVLWRTRLKGTYWATPIAAGGYLYCINQDGIGSVVRAGDKGEIVSTNRLASDGEQFLGSPATDGHALYVRSGKHLWKIAEPGK